MVGRAVTRGVLTGAALGILVMLGFGAVDATEYDLGALVAILVVYLPLALGFGAVIGVIEALVVVGAVLALRGFVAGRTVRAQVVAAVAAALPGLVLLELDVSPPVGVPFTLACVVGAVLWTPSVVRAPR